MSSPASHRRVTVRYMAVQPLKCIDINARTEPGSHNTLPVRAFRLLLSEINTGSSANRQ